jgi:hypothetical protein
MRQWRGLAIALCVVAFSTMTVWSQVPASEGGLPGGDRPPPPPPPKVHPRDLSGYWALPPIPSDGRYIPTAALVPAVTRQRLAEVAAKDREAVRYCNQVGLPTVMGLGFPYNIRINPHFMVILTQYSAAQNRIIYLDRKEHLLDEAYDRGGYGDSIGHWEGNVLVVDTTMFAPDRGILSIPGGGFRTATSHLVERFQLLKNGQVLQLISTWTDANVFKGSHSYEYRYSRMPRDYEARLGLGCDPYDADRAAFLAKGKGF